MKDLIDRQAAIDAVGDIHPLDYNSRAIVERLKTLPSADVEPVRHGRWKDYPIADGCIQCSCCGVLRMGEPSNYCPNCGARLDGDANAE